MKRRIVVALSAGLVIAGFVFCKPPVAMAGVHVNVGINLPLPVLQVPAPPAVAVIPGTYVYFAPGIDADILFYHDYWYRPYRGGWYRSRGYNGPWNFVPERGVPRELYHLPPGYRHLPAGYERIPYGQMKKNWRNWEREKYWDRRERREVREHRRHERERWREERREHRREYRDYGDRGDNGNHGRHRDD